MGRPSTHSTSPLKGSKKGGKTSEQDPMLAESPTEPHRGGWAAVDEPRKTAEPPPDPPNFAFGGWWLRQADRVLKIRDQIRKEAWQDWSKEVGPPKDPCELPAEIDGYNLRRLLKQSQDKDLCTRAMAKQISDNLTYATPRAGGDPSAVKPFKPLELCDYRLAPEDHLLERRVHLVDGTYWVPVVPDDRAPGQNVSWSRWFTISIMGPTGRQEKRSSCSDG